ncbi:MAG: hypothetical protein M5U05_19450 [Anaerolineales bacterium]|nr:hypothetical protein [Anaerolineales bacterium]
MNNDIPSLLASIVEIQQAAIRAIRLESDLHHAGLAQGYVLTSQALACLGRIVTGLDEKRPARAWTLTGPYGSGKSYFGLFLLNLLGKTQTDHATTMRALEQVDPVLAREVHEAQLDGSRGFFPIPVTGYRAPLQECLSEGLAHAVRYLKDEGIAAQSLVEAEPERSPETSRAILRRVSRLLQFVVDNGYRGIVLIIDELGKPLEFAAAHPEEADIYLLQELAEFANRSANSPVVVIGILHQAFERYAVFLDSVTQQEWAKVQGRFEDIPFQEPPLQQLHLLARAIVYQDEALRGMEIVLRDQAQLAVASGWCLPAVQEANFIELALSTYPLHPTTLVALPLVFRRLAQNERSIFAYLTSHEPNGFQEFLQQHETPAFVSLADLFDYVAANFQGRLYASGRGRVLAETLDRLNSTSLLTPLESALFKSVGLINWLGETSHLRATEEALMAALSGLDYREGEVRQALETLRQRSMLVYRRFNRSYVIWQGSDVDIEDRLQQAHRHLGGAFSPVEMLHKYLPPRPLVARRHSYGSGTARYFEVRYADKHTDRHDLLRQPDEASGIVVLCLPLTTAGEREFVDWAQSASLQSHGDVVIGVAHPVPRLTELLHELRALQWVYEHTPELRDDTVARQEWRARVSAVEALVQQYLDEAYGPHQLARPATCHWYHRGVDVSQNLGRNLTSFLSAVCDQIYHATPRVWNELLNRRALSSQAAAARRNLIQAMLTQPHHAALGIEGYPPERSMYESLLNAGGLHRRDSSGDWCFAPPSEPDRLRLIPLWQAMADYVFAPPVETRPVAELFRHLKAPPYGVTDGVLPVLLCAFYLVHQDEMTLYREGSLLPEPNIADWEVLLRRPDLFALGGCRLTGPRRAILDRFARNLGTEVAVMPVVRELLRQMKTLPEHAWRTQRLPDHALRVRLAMERARSPEQLLFGDLPGALDLPPFADQKSSSRRITLFFDRLNAALQALSEATPQVRAWARDELLTACGLPGGEAGWQQFLTLADTMADYTMHPKLLPMLQRAIGAPDAQSALDSVLAYVASRPLRTWTDADADRFPAQARAVGGLFEAEQYSSEDDALLTSDEQALSRSLASDLEDFLEPYYNEDQRAVRAALRRLLRRK